MYAEFPFSLTPNNFPYARVPLTIIFIYYVCIATNSEIKFLCSISTTVSSRKKAEKKE